MKCHQAKLRLDKYGWRQIAINSDSELLEHLKLCLECKAMAAAESMLQSDLDTQKTWKPEKNLEFDDVRASVDARAKKTSVGAIAGKPPRTIMNFLFANAGRRVVVAAVVAAFALLALVPLNFQEQVGYQIAIDGVGKDLAIGNQKITALLGALGMESNETTNLLDSLGSNQITFSIGECSETCRLTISDLKTERDVRLMIKAIIDLGCCRINGVEPIFRNETSSILEYTAKKLLS